MELTAEQIQKINRLAPNKWQTNEQGIFSEPWGIPDTVKGLVVYMRWETGGVSGGSCWDDSDPRPYFRGDKPDFKVLDLVLQELMPNISYLQYKQLENLIQSSEKTEWEYYGNQTDFGIQYIPLADLISWCEKQQ